VFYIEIGPHLGPWNANGKKVGNIKELWHGTRVGNVLSIMKGGFVIPPSNASHVTGRMFGNGVYFSDQSTKSLNYAYGCAPGQKGGIEKSTFMFLSDVAMGKEYIPSSWGGNLPMPGYDSTYAMAGRSGVQNNEMIVYKTYQINPRYLVEFR
ncbi:hypothetical protein ACI4CU_27210, partial [Klebsiella pneumoniae]|uniref:hypothetical protein n=2 Tax=Enterobacteriaceae TaxID=543 RepID=UPI003853B38A